MTELSQERQSNAVSASFAVERKRARDRLPDEPRRDIFRCLLVIPLVSMLCGSPRRSDTTATPVISMIL